MQSNVSVDICFFAGEKKGDEEEERGKNGMLIAGDDLPSAKEKINFSTVEVNRPVLLMMRGGSRRWRVLRWAPGEQRTRATAQR